MNSSHKCLPGLQRIWRHRRSTSKNWRDFSTSVVIARTNVLHRQLLSCVPRSQEHGCRRCERLRSVTSSRSLSNFYHGPEHGRHNFMTEEEISDETATKILRQHEMSVTMKEDFDHKNVNPVTGFESNILPSNSPLEDRRAQAKFHHHTDLGMLFGVFDGHGGHQCANAVSDRLFMYLALSLLPNEDLQSTLRDLDSGKPWPALLEWYQHSSLPPGKSLRPHQEEKLRKFLERRLNGEIRIKNLEDAMCQACLTLDADILSDAQNQTVHKILKHARPDLAAIDCAMSGAVGCFTHISQDTITVANVGDSGAVLGSRDLITPGRWIATPLSWKHNAMNDDERERILSEHPALEKDALIKNGRLLGSLAPFRAFGNARFKWPVDVINDVAYLSQDGDEEVGVGGDYRIPDQANWVLPFYRTPPYLTARPDVTQHEIQPNDAFIVIATDGLWETMHKRHVVQIIGEHFDRLEGNHYGQTSELSESDILDSDTVFFGFEDTNSATNIIRHCIGQTFDGPSRRQVRQMLCLPKEESRFYRDDISVTVVKINPLGS